MWLYIHPHLSQEARSDLQTDWANIKNKQLEVQACYITLFTCYSQILWKAIKLSQPVGI